MLRLPVPCDERAAPLGELVVIDAALDVRAAPAQVAVAREFVRDRCRDWQLTALTDDAVLVVSELVTNALLHARSARIVKLTLTASRLRIEVQDHERQPPVLRRPGPDTQHGRGLQIVAALATDWGSYPNGTGKWVWAELVRRPSGQLGDRPSDSTG